MSGIERFSSMSEDERASTYFSSDLGERAKMREAYDHAVSDSLARGVQAFEEENRGQAVYPGDPSYKELGQLRPTE